MKTTYFIIVFCYLSFYGFAQSTPTQPKPDSAIINFPKADSLGLLRPAPAADSILIKKPPVTLTRVTPSRADSTFEKDTINADFTLPGNKKNYYNDQLIADHPFLGLKKIPVYRITRSRDRLSKDEIFYLLAGFLLFLACIRLAFSKYFKNIFRLFFQPSFRQKQTREQLLQSSLPSLLLNLFFIVSGGLYISLLIQHYQLVTVNFWWLFLYCSASVGILYTCKFIFLSFSGWVFNVKEASDTYMFVVYLINKILGVIFIPFILIIAFSDRTLVNVSITISFLLTICLFIYRYVISYAPVRREIKVNPLHFLFYVSAFEIAPLLVIYRLLMRYLANSL